MFNNIVIIASDAGFLIDTLREKLHDAGFKVMVAGNDSDLNAKIKIMYPRYIFLEECFLENRTDEFVNKIMKVYRQLHIVIWAACKIKPMAAARFIHAGAESFFSLRENGDSVEKILAAIAGGRRYCSADVEAVLDNENSIPIFGVPITKRELQIIRLFNKSDKEIAEMLSISISTVNFHKSNIYKKCTGKRKNEILSEAIGKGIIQPGELH